MQLLLVVRVCCIAKQFANSCGSESQGHVVKMDDHVKLCKKLCNKNIVS